MNEGINEKNLELLIEEIKGSPYFNMLYSNSCIGGYATRILLKEGFISYQYNIHQTLAYILNIPSSQAASICYDVSPFLDIPPTYQKLIAVDFLEKLKTNPKLVWKDYWPTFTKDIVIKNSIPTY